MILNYSSFKKSDISQNSNFLFYGENEGRIEECSETTINAIKKKFGTLCFSYFSSDDLKKGVFSKIFFDSANSDLFGNKNVLIVSLQDQKASKEIVDILKKVEESSLILIIKCSELKKNSSLRVFFEDSKQCLITPCYEENEIEKKILVKDFFESENLSVSDEEINTIVNMLSNERLEIKNELNKLVIYMKNSKKDVANSLNIISENITENINQLIFSLASRNKKDFLTKFFKFKDIQSDHIKLINTLSGHLMRVLEVKAKIKSGVDKSHAIKSLRPPVFFKDLPAFNKHIDIWSEDEINYFLGRLFVCQVSNLNGLKSCKFQLYFLFLKILNFRKIT